MKFCSSTILFCVVIAGGFDGSWRAQFQQRTILGQRVELEPFESYHRPNLNYESTSGHQCLDSWQCNAGQVCRGNKCGSCMSDSECITRNPNNQCSNTTFGNALCKHKALWISLNESDYLMMAITVMAIMLSAPAGVGGGCILVPMFLTIGGFSSHYSSALSTATIFGGAAANNFFNIAKRHPTKNRPLIDFNACMILVPVLLLGTVLGVFFNEIAPRWLISVLLVIALVYTTWRTTLKAIETYDKENESEKGTEKSRLLPSNQLSKEHAAHLYVHHHPAVTSNNSDAEKSASASSTVHITIKPVTESTSVWSQEIDQIVQAESGMNRFALGALFLSWVFIAVFSVLKGGDGAQGIAPCGSGLYWALVAAPVPLVCALVCYLGSRVSAEHEAKVAYGYDFADGDLQWTRRNAVVYPLYCASAGVCAGALGIAAGMVLGPLLLELGMLPVVATASSGLMVLFVSSSTAFQYLVMGQLPADYAATFCALGAVAGAVGNTVVGHLIKRYRKTWFVVALLAFVFAVSAAFMALSAVAREATARAHGVYEYGHPLCPPPPTLLHRGA